MPRRAARSTLHRYPRAVVGTAKRERQKANRQQRLIEEAKVERTSKMKRSILRGAAAVILAIGAVVLIAWAGGAFDGDDEAALDEATIDEATVATTPIDTTPVETFPVPPKPEVEIPAETPEDLVVSVLSAGDGPEAQAGDTVMVHYVGVRSEDGTEFDNSYERGTPFPVTLGQGGVIAGWDEGLVGAQAGSQIQLDIPNDLAYGDSARGDIIQAGDALSFVIDVMSVTPAG